MSENVCANQDRFNVAVRKAIRKNNEDAVENSQNWILLYVLLMLGFLIWAVTLAMKMPKGPEKILHLVIAMVASPVYVLAYYVGEVKK